MHNTPRIMINGMNAFLGGGQTYLLNLLTDTPKAEIYLLVPKELMPHFSGTARVKMIDVGRWNANPVTRVLWENWILPGMIRRLGIDVYFSTGGLLPWRKLDCRTVSAFRNMLPFSDVDRRKFPLGYKRLRYFLLKAALSRSFSKADVVIFISTYAKQVIDALLPNRAGQSQVIYHGVADQYRRIIELPRPTELPFPYVLYVSILNVYKCHLEVVEAWRLLRQERKSAEKLVFIGPEYPPYAAKVRRLIKDAGLTDQVLLLGKIPHEKLPAYYQHARANIFASTCENCPNVLLEALASGTPVLSSDIQPMPEIAGAGAKLFSPFNPRALREALAEVLENAQVAEKMAKQASLRAQDFSWTKTRDHTWKLLMSVAGRPGVAHARKERAL